MVPSQLPASIGPVLLTLFRPGRKEGVGPAPGPLRGLRSELRHEPSLPGALHLWITLKYVCVPCFYYSGGGVEGSQLCSGSRDKAGAESGVKASGGPRPP